MTTVKVSPKYQIVIPKMVRTRLQVKPGDTLELLEPRPGVIEFFKPEDIDMKAMRGMVQGTGGWREIQKQRREDARGEL